MRVHWVLLAFALAVIQPSANAEIVPVDSPRWQVLGTEAEVLDYQGRHAIFLPRSAVALEDANFETGVIELDMAIATADRSFPGVYFRGVDGANYEHFYLRPHQNGRPDATQYTPVFNDRTGWQIFSGERYGNQMTFPIGSWFHVKLEVAEDSARIYVNSEEATLVVHDLKRDRAPGFILLKGSSAGAYFANIDITPGAQPEAPPEPAFDLPEGLVRAWSVSQPMPETDALAAAIARRWNALTWISLPVETNGIANLGRLADVAAEKTTMLARFNVRSDRARSALLRFGFSDRVHVYVNGALLYTGDDTQSSRDYRFLGIVGLWDGLQVPLRRGDNDIVFAVFEGAGGAAVGGGGWAAQAAFPDSAGLTLTDQR
jgi:hypothetical protein